MSHHSSPPPKHKGEHKGHGLPRGSERGSSSRDKDRSATTVSSSAPMPAGGKSSRTNCPPPAPPKTVNRLINEKSPYLLQHAYNPVDWYPWGQEAFDKAKKENKPIFLSVGYSTCHWCHMMEEESFQNEEIGRLLNENFICVMVDREERPDVDKVYMTFVQATSSGGGWPMNVWLTPGLQPFVGGTYFPPEDGLTRVGFRTVLMRICDQWKLNKNTLLENSQRVTTALLARSEISVGDRQIPASAATMNSRCFQQLDEGYDEEYGGFAEAPKFPTPVILNFLFSYWLSHRLTQDGSRAQQMALHTLKMMANGGIQDHVGQGFHRYSTDRQWHIPHFEKMLYDQAQLSVVYTQAFQISGDEFYADVAKGILQYVTRTLSHRSGGFYSAEDADSPPERGMKPQEGAYYVWTVKEVQQLLPEPVVGASEPLTSGQLLMKHYGLSEVGNINSSQDPNGELHGQNVLMVRYSLELTAARYGLEVEAVRALLNTGLEKLFQARKHRPKAHLDNKMLAAWNGLMVSGFAVTGAALGMEKLVAQATSGAKFLKRHMFDVSSGRLKRTCYAGTGGTVEQSNPPCWGFLEDYAFVVRGLLDLYEASQESSWLEWALRLQDTQDKLFWDPRGGGYFCSEAELGADLPLRLKDDQDGAEPSANSVSAHNLLRLHSFTGHKDWMDKCVCLLTAFSERMRRVPVALPEMVRTLSAQQQTLKQIVICGDPQAKDTKALLQCVHSIYVPNKVLILADGDPSSFLSRQLPFLSSLRRVEDRATVYIFENQACSMPITDPCELRKLLHQ
ncbi:spermatogenesis-associated protein 20 [Mus musculus]|uniref:Spermatogenesis-associated protein 20 n=1 Tax=Mus musculus TaxID=10090 RepID=SPT20_MOUSE|nr:spermatogenesis-associated protein 20 [Mus musculus]Q80YT5.1 RecName: Full=Spermatogenesis-associated protein 20; AltName: Full=Sperm-specific protein 411; Short=Ssp411; AltName: Full=Transcript increased in spermiogenesis 78 protein [Mus musculus]AAH50788.1 Spermatogenesis associated 20 [Mus musculus]|eukprot:NP_659076.2 spermatogenesis-associated protein 20 [Mus musculus]